MKLASVRSRRTGPRRHSPDTTLLSTPGPSRRWCHRYFRCRAKAWHTFCNIRPRLFISAKLLCGIDPSLFGFLVMIKLLIRNPKVMGEHVVRRWLYALGLASEAFCIVGMFASLVCP